MERVGKYKILSELARGSMGIIYKGEDETLGRPVAVKVMNDSLAADETMVSRFKNEAKAAALLNHPNIVTIHDFGREEGQFYIVMEYLIGQNLKEIFESGDELTIIEKLDIVIKICEGLHYAHDKNVIHRDIKPANIVITRDRHVKITDFGIAHLESSHITKTGTLVGTPDYMSPEQVLSKKIDRRSDIFSVGVILYQLVAGRKPFQANSISSVMYKIANDEPPRFDALKIAVPFEVESIILRAMEKNPMKRYQDLEIMIGDLRTARNLITGSANDETFTKIAEGKYMSEEAERLLKENRPEEALSVLERAINNDPDNKLLETLQKKAENALLKEKNQRIRKIILRAETAASGGNLEEALVIARSAFEIVPENAIASDFTRKITEQIRKNTGESEDSIETRVMTRFEAQKQLKKEENATRSVKRKDNEETEFHSTGTRSVLMALPKDLRQLIEDADSIYYRRKNVIEVIFSINKLMKALSLDSESYEAIHRLSRNYYMKGNLITRTSEQKRAFNQGISWAKRAVELIDTRVEGHYWLAVNLSKWGDVNGIFRGAVILKRTFQALDKVIELDDQYSGGGGYRILGRIKYRLPTIIGGDIDESIELLEKARAIEPRNPDTLLFLAETYIGAEKLEEAKAVLEDLMTMDPHHHWRFETEHDRKLAEDLIIKVDKLMR